MRTALNRARREGVIFTLHEGGSLPAAVAEQLAAIDDQCQRGRALPPMEFTQGRVEDVRDPHVEVAVATDPSGRVLAYVDWLPIPAQNGRVIDLMRRRDDAMSGVMEYVIGMSLLTFQQRGEQVASLATAPLADLDRDRAHSVLPHVLGLVYENAGPYYSFKTLFEFKERFQPRWEPVHLVYRDASELPSAAMAILRAHLPDLDAQDVVRLLGAREARSRPTGDGAALQD